MEFLPETQQMAQAPDAVAKNTAKQAKLKSIGIPVLAGLLGLSLGSTTAASSTKTEIAELRAVEQTLVGDVKSLRAATAAAVAELGEAEAERDSSVMLINQREGEIGDLKSQIEKLQTQLTEIEAQAAQAQAAATEATAALSAVAPDPAGASATPEPVPFAGPPAASSFANCTAARNAGAAPVYAGDPGYGRHLDRDGDGVGCE